MSAQRSETVKTGAEGAIKKLLRNHGRVKREENEKVLVIPAKKKKEGKKGVVNPHPPKQGSPPIWYDLPSPIRGRC